MKVFRIRILLILVQWRCHRPGLLWPLFGISDFFSQIWHMFWFRKLHFLLAPFSPLTLIFFLFEKILLYHIFFGPKVAKVTPLVWAYFGHPYETLLKVAFGVNLYKHSVSMVSFPHISSIFNDIFIIQYHKNRRFCFKAKIECGATLATHKNTTKMSLKWLYKKMPK